MLGRKRLDSAISTLGSTNILHVVGDAFLDNDKDVLDLIDRRKLIVLSIGGYIHGVGRYKNFLNACKELKHLRIKYLDNESRKLIFQKNSKTISLHNRNMNGIEHAC